MKAIYRPVGLAQADQQPTLIYNTKDGFAWVKTPENNDWHCFNPTAIGAEGEARKAGFDPQAIAYITR